MGELSTRRTLRCKMITTVWDPENPPDAKFQPRTRRRRPQVAHPMQRANTPIILTRARFYRRRILLGGSAFMAENKSPT
ncbi:uncharacterized protein DFL_005555 [Arthrobotrys flagrans]|uniref:Uncharacterized protein n=1 Tax=Arthrobotrys flagrans TaxID=97331 RepID=A0A436ZXR2_ARTFL|nr:hypothetical protein DFL_005555 [Arthrobotrys flagrans]